MELNWTTPAIYGPVLEAEFDGGRVELWLDHFDHHINPVFVVHVDGRAFSTDDSRDWPEVEQIIPREQWPEPMFVGKRGPKNRHPDKAVAEAVAAYKAEHDRLLAELEEEERLALEELYETSE